MTRRYWIAVLLLVACWSCSFPKGYSPKEGDFVFQSLPNGELIQAIEGISSSPYSHVGLVISKYDNWYVREAYRSVTDTPLKEWKERGRYKHAYAVFRLRAGFQAKVPAMVKASEAFLGRPYDFKYQMDDEKIYCSELIYKAMLNSSGIRLGKLQKLGELNWQPYSAFIEKSEGAKTPLEREMITPQSLSEAKELEKVYDGYQQ